MGGDKSGCRVHVKTTDLHVLFQAAYMLVRIFVLLVAHAVSHWRVNSYHERPSHSEDRNWRNIDPEVTAKDRVMCTDCPWYPKCCEQP